MSEIDDIRDWHEISAHVREVVNSLETCGICEKVTECVRAKEVLDQPGAYGDAMWACSECIQENAMVLDECDRPSN